MNKQETYDYLTRKGIEYEVTEHKAVFNMAELDEVNLPYPKCDAKNLFVRDDRKKNYYLITVKGDKRVNLKEFRKQNGTKPLTFASPEDLFTIMGLTPGSVTPLGVLNDTEMKVHAFIDKDFLDKPQIIGVHPNDNTATVWLKTEELIELMRKHGNTVDVVNLND